MNVSLSSPAMLLTDPSDSKRSWSSHRWIENGGAGCQLHRGQVNRESGSCSQHLWTNCERECCAE